MWSILNEYHVMGYWFFSARQNHLPGTLTFLRWLRKSSPDKTSHISHSHSHKSRFFYVKIHLWGLCEIWRRSLGDGHVDADPFINVPHSIFIPLLLQGDLSDIVTDSIQYSARGTCENIRDERHYPPFKKNWIQFPPYPDCDGFLLNGGYAW